MTTGWFTGLVPVTVDVGAGLFEDAAHSAQTSFDSGIELAIVPFDRVLELAPPEAGLGRPRPGNFVMSFLDASITPPVLCRQLRVELSDLLARESVGRYIEAMKSAYVRIADGRRSQAFAHSRARLTALT